MAFDQTTSIALSVLFLGSVSFAFGIVAENKKACLMIRSCFLQPAFGTPIQGKDVIICNFPDDPTVLLGTSSVVTLILAAVAGHVAIYFPYKGKSVPSNALFQNTILLPFFIVAEGVTFIALAMLVWTTVSEGLHRSRNVHHDLTTRCPTAKTGLFGGGAFLALDAAIFWLICQMLTMNARSDYFNEDDPIVEYGEFNSVTDMESIQQLRSECEVAL
ncbi:unnamed protein product [Musa acuminata subsp. malaccensis]|uniref:(wild Malaysian banana) hypothetical protein n=1 Tax=Musa acuminata subsp. malaccensis TaxID=214687 RepID=A0A8D7AMY0_MUSAM|nr:unnamed protein product [Musa acuminata subsp. malaccensis]